MFQYHNSEFHCTQSFKLKASQNTPVFYVSFNPHLCDQSQSAFISCVYCRGCIFNIITHNSDKRHLQAYQSKQSEIIAVNCTFWQ